MGAAGPRTNAAAINPLISAEPCKPQSVSYRSCYPVQNSLSALSAPLRLNLDMLERTLEGALSLAYVEGPRNGPPLLFCHGVLRGWRDFAPLFPSFVHRWHVHGLDFRGHGGSGRASGAYRIMEYAQDAVAVLRHLDEPAVIYGHSLGALVATVAAAAEPERVRAVILEDPPLDTLGPSIGKTSFHAQFTGMREARLAGHGSVAELAAALAEIRLPTAAGTVRLGDVRDGTQLRLSARCLLSLDPAVFDPFLAGQWFDGYDEASVLARIACPALLLVGNPDRGGMLQSSAADRVQAQLADCVRVDLPEAGHLLHWTHTETVLRLALAFTETL